MSGAQLKQLSVHDLLHHLRSQVGAAIEAEAQLIRPTEGWVDDPTDPSLICQIGDFRICARFMEGE